MSLRSRLGTFVLTRQEQRTIAFIVLAVILGLLTQHYRHAATKETPRGLPEAATPTTSFTPSPSPSSSGVGSR